MSEVTHALCKAASEIPDVEAVLYGSGPDENKIHDIIKTYDKNTPVKVGGLIEFKKMQKKLLENNVFVLLSDYEGLPVSLMEAMACGLVPVCYNINSGIPELIDHNISGLLVNDRESDFYDSILRLKNEDGLWEKLSNGAKRKD
ncbi:MAG: glycosyltransferase [Balneolaceae bacterium]|nr:glycosyltransferase [Balneolaceae bacterium]